MEDLTLTIDDDALTTGRVLELMQLQGALRGADPEQQADALARMVALLQPTVTAINYKGRALANLNDVPFKHLRRAVELVMGAIGKTDPN